MAAMSVPGKSARILVVDDGEEVQRLLKAVLGRKDYEVLLASDGNRALDLAAEYSPDLVILDLSLPALGGLEVCRELRSWSSTPILVVSGTRDEAVKVAALDLGADDYVTKPFTNAELLARVRALLRRSAGWRPGQPVIQAGDLEVNLAQRLVTVAGRPIRLTRTEFEIMAFLARNANCVVTAKMILRKVWGPDYVADSQTLRVHVGHLRKKIEPEPSMPRYILTEPGIGYRLNTS